MPSSEPPKPSFGADARSEPASPAPLVTVARLLAERGVYGVIWLDDDLVVTARYGRLADFAEVGSLITDVFLPLIGLERELSSLKTAPNALLELPAVAIGTSDGTSPRLNLAAIWSDVDEALILLVSRAVGRSDLEHELSRQMRARLIAEAAVSEKSRELARANAELERANGDLEEFAAIISHDLKAPLRALRYLSSDLETEIGDAGTGVREKLAQIREQAARMSSMLTSLLEYSSVGRKEEVIETIDTGSLIAAVVRSMPRPAGVEIEIDGLWPRMATLAAPLDLVLRNLIDNAIKHHDRPQGLIRVIAEDLGSTLAITVSDDGPGIAKHHQEAAFLPFRKLALGNSTSGDGMGLAFVKRTVESVGGTLSLASDPEIGRGASFCIAWPKALPSQS